MVRNAPFFADKFRPFCQKMALLKKAIHLVGPILFIFIFIKFIDLNMLLNDIKNRFSAIFIFFFSF